MAQRLTAAARREQLLDVALDVFSSNGFHNTSMNEVAEAAGVTKPVLYQHFASKRELYLALLQEEGARLLSAITDATRAAESPRAQVEQGLGAYFRWVADDRDAFVLLFGSGARRDEVFAEEVRRVEDAIAAAVAPLIQADIDADHQEALAYALVGLSEGTARHLVHRGTPFDPERLALQMADLAWAGLRAVKRV
jgi:AcrR family transcriptional regulator